MNRNSVPLLSAAHVFAAVVGLSHCANAQSISVTNPSFESPQIPAGFPALTMVNGWQKNPAPPPQFGITADQWDQMAGVFPNPAEGQPRHLTNADGSQVAYLFAVQGVGLSQEVTSKYTAGLGYELQVGARGGGSLTPGTQFQIGLYYSDNGTAVPIGGTVFMATDSLTTASALQDFKVTLGTVKAGDAWNGRNIGVSLTSFSQNGAAGIAYWELDKVRLVATPEPSTWMLGGVGMVVLWAVGRRRQQS